MRGESKILPRSLLYATYSLRKRDVDNRGHPKRQEFCTDSDTFTNCKISVKNRAHCWLIFKLKDWFSKSTPQNGGCAWKRIIMGLFWRAHFTQFMEINWERNCTECQKKIIKSKRNRHEKVWRNKTGHIIRKKEVLFLGGEEGPKQTKTIISKYKRDRIVIVKRNGKKMKSIIPIKVLQTLFWTRVLKTGLFTFFFLLGWDDSMWVLPVTG